MPRSLEEAKALTTHAQIVALKPGASPYERAIESARGLRIRVSTAGRKAWEYRYTAVDGSRRRLPLGNFPGLSYAAAVEKARALHVAVVENKDPAAERRAAKAVARTGETLDDLANAWLEASKIGDHGGRKKAPKSEISIANEERRYRVHIKPVFGNRAFLSITRDELKSFMNGLVNAQKLSADSIASVGTTLSGIFSYGVYKSLIQVNPMLGLTRPLDTVARDRMFDDQAIRVIWTGLETADPPVRLAVKLMILTGTRVGDVAAARWEEFNFTDNTWTIPAQRHKSKRAFVVALCAEALAVLASAAEHQRGPNAKLVEMKSGFVFPSPKAKGSIQTRSLSQAVSRICKAKKLKHGSSHDFRRSIATLLAARAGIDEITIDRVLSHTVSTKLSRVYNKHQYLAEKRRTLQAWEDILKAILVKSENASAAA